jgi:hypothetical protein
MFIKVYKVIINIKPRSLEHNDNESDGNIVADSVTYLRS